MPFAIGPVLVKVFSSIMMSLLTEKFIKSLVVIMLEKMVQSTNNDLDDKLFEQVKDALK